MSRSGVRPLLKRWLAALVLVLVGASDFAAVASAMAPCCDPAAKDRCARCHPAKPATRHEHGPAKASSRLALPSCHGGGAAASEAAEPGPGAKCSLSAGCKCGHSHAPSGVHRDHPATLAPGLSAESPDPGGPPFLGGCCRASSPLSQPDPPPPRLQTA